MASGTGNWNSKFCTGALVRGEASVVSRLYTVSSEPITRYTRQCTVPRVAAVIDLLTHTRQHTMGSKHSRYSAAVNCSYRQTQSAGRVSGQCIGLRWPDAGCVAYAQSGMRGSWT